MSPAFVPTTDLQQVAQQLEDAKDGPLLVLLGAVCGEPATGVTIVSQRGRVLFRNVQAARIFHDTEENANRVLGKYWHDYMPVEWVRERLLLLRRLLEQNKPALMRTLWRDAQHLTWIYPMVGGRDGEDRLFLLITRRVSKEEQAAIVSAASTEFEVVESSVIRLQTLDSLSNRELGVLAMLGSGQSIAEVALALGLSEKTVDNHRGAIYSKLRISDRSQLLSIVARAGLTVADAGRKRV